MVTEVKKLFGEQFGPQELIDALELKEAAGIIVIILGKDDVVNVCYSTMSNGQMCFCAKVLDDEVTKLIYSS